MSEMYIKLCDIRTKVKPHIRMTVDNFSKRMVYNENSILSRTQPSQTGFRKCLLSPDHPIPKQDFKKVQCCMTGCIKSCIFIKKHCSSGCTFNQGSKVHSLLITVSFQLNNPTFRLIFSLKSFRHHLLQHLRYYFAMLFY